MYLDSPDATEMKSEEMVDGSGWGWIGELEHMHISDEHLDRGIGGTVVSTAAFQRQAFCSDITEHKFMAHKPAAIILVLCVGDLEQLGTRLQPFTEGWQCLSLIISEMEIHFGFIRHIKYLRKKKKTTHKSHYFKERLAVLR